jgi:hypothetical protein
LAPIDSTERTITAKVLPLVDGESLRDWSTDLSLEILWPINQYGERLEENEITDHINLLWPYRETLKGRKAFGVPVEIKGIPWWAIREVYTNRFKTPFSIAFAFVATHNHFVLDRGGKVFKQSAPVIKLPPEATERDHLALLGLLNSSTACFWMQQTCHNKGRPGADAAAADEPWEFRVEFDGTKLKSFPIASGKTIDYTIKLDQFSQELQIFSPGTF